MTASSSASPQRAAQIGDPSDAETNAQTDPHIDPQADPGRTEGALVEQAEDADKSKAREERVEARRAAALAARAEAEAAREARLEAEAARQARLEARQIAETNKAEKELARAEAEALKTEAIANAAPPVRRARFRRRHYAMLTSFVFLVALPAALTGWYLWERAVDQYASHVGFSVRTEEQGTSIEGLFGVSDISGSSSSDTDILYEFLQGQQLVALVDERLDLREIWSRPGTEQDPVFAYDAPGTIEDLTKHWGHKVKIYYDSNSGLIDLRVLAFDPADATAIAPRDL